jgi:glycosyltransferase involved in cell wall biosynthesis
MLTVIIPTHESERSLVRTLSCLVPGATGGVVREVILADAGSRDETAGVGDVAGCKFMVLSGTPGARLRSAASAARSDWLFFLLPGTVLDTGWVGEAIRFIETAEHSQAAVFRRAARPAAQSSTLGEIGALIRAGFNYPRPEQGLIVSKRHYTAIGGHDAVAANPESELLRRLGRSHIVRLRSGATMMAPLAMVDKVK